MDNTSLVKLIKELLTYLCGQLNIKPGYSEPVDIHDLSQKLPDTLTLYGLVLVEPIVKYLATCPPGTKICLRGLFGICGGCHNCYVHQRIFKEWGILKPELDTISGIDSSSVPSYLPPSEGYQVVSPPDFYAQHATYIPHHATYAPATCATHAPTIHAPAHAYPSHSPATRVTHPSYAPVAHATRAPQTTHASYTTPTIPCRHGADCWSQKCTFWHPPERSTKVCKHGSHCCAKENGCPFTHPPMPDQTTFTTGFASVPTVSTTYQSYVGHASIPTIPSMPVGHSGMPSTPVTGTTGLVKPAFAPSKKRLNKKRKHGSGSKTKKNLFGDDKVSQRSQDSSASEPTVAPVSGDPTSSTSS